MAHEIFGTRFLGRREPAWHRLGQVFDEPLTASEAVRRCGADYTVDVVPCLADYCGHTIEVPDRQVIVRDPTHDDPQPRALGVVSNNYKFLQNTELARMLNPISDEWPVETVGVLQYGARVFITFDAGRGHIAGEEMREYFLVVDSKDGSKGLSILFTPVRVVCQNTLSLGMDQSTGGMTVRHIGELRRRTELVVRLMREMRVTRQRYRDELDALAHRHLTAEQVETVLARVYPKPKPGGLAKLAEQLDDEMVRLDVDDQTFLTQAIDDHEFAMYRQRGHQEEVTNLYKRLNDEYPAIACTHWALFNAVVEYADYRESRSNPRLAAQSIVFGTRAEEKRRCYRALMALAG